MLSYSSFKTFLASFLWKSSDSELIANLDSLITMANAELNRKLTIQRRQVTALLTVTTQDTVLPSDFRSMVSLTNLAAIRGRDATMHNTTLLDVYKRRTLNGGVFEPVYAVDSHNETPYLRLVGPFSADSPGSMALVYKADVPDFKVVGFSWVAESFLDLYTYTVLSHTAPFLREDERVPLWVQYKLDAIESALREDKHEVEFGGSPLLMRPHHAIP